MDQPTTIKIKITGNYEAVKCAALAAQKGINLNTIGYKKDDYNFGDGTDIESRLSKAIGFLADYKFTEKNNGTLEYKTEQESYGCLSKEDIVEIGNEIVKVSPDVNFKISAVITITYAEGYDVCVTVDYKKEKMKVSTSLKYYDEDYDDFD